MDRELWSKVDSLFNAATAVDPCERERFIYVHSEDDEVVRREVISLLACHEMVLKDGAVVDPLSGAAAAVSDLMEAMKGWSETTRAHHRLEEAPVTGESAPEVAEMRTHHPVQSVWQRVKGHAPELEFSRVICRGGSATVFQARCALRGRDVAVKVLSAVDADDDQRRRFVAGPVAAARVYSPWLTRVLQARDYGDVQFLVMDFVHGESLQQILARRALPGPRQAVFFVCQLALGLHELHRNGFVHCDVKPANVIVEYTAAGRFARLTDFGALRGPAVDTDRSGQVYGTPGYMSPEQVLRPEMIDGRSDVFGIGVTLYRMLTGVMPYRGTPDAIIRKIRGSAPALPRNTNPNVPTAVEKVCLKAIEYEPERRHQSVVELLCELQSCYPVLRGMMNCPTGNLNHEVSRV